MHVQPEGWGIMLRKIRWMLPLAGLFVVLGVVAACGDDDDGGSEADKQEVSDTVKQVAEAGVEQSDFFLAHVTDDFVQLITDGGTVDDCEAALDECLADPLTDVIVGDVTIDGDAAKTDIVGTDVDGENTFGVSLIKDGDVWKLDGLFVLSDEVPDGVEVVDLQLSEFAFGFDQASDAVKGGNFAFHVKNIGNQQHMVGILKIPEDADAQEIINSDDEDIPGVERIDFRFPYNPGDESDFVLDAPLAPGRYLMACYIPDANDPDGTPHAFKGMTAEFTVE